MYKNKINKINDKNFNFESKDSYENNIKKQPKEGQLIEEKVIFDGIDSYNSYDSCEEIKILKIKKIVLIHTYKYLRYS